MKIAVYTIALNEEQFVERWYEAHKDADYLLIADTGSTDKTVKAAKKLGINVVSISIKPWRFDDARNAAIALLPPDIDVCISVDMDEMLAEGWREDVEAKWRPEVTRGKFQYIWSHLDDGSNGITFWYDKLHSRHGYRWVHPVHEVLAPDRIEEVTEWFGFELHHWPDHTKSRGQYLPLLELSVKEDPNDPRNSHYYGRELMFYGKHDEAIAELQRHLDLPGSDWINERCASMRYMARCHKAKGDWYNALLWQRRAVAEAPNTREPWVELARTNYELGRWADCYSNATAALEIENKPNVYICEPEAWGEQPHDLAAIAAYRLGMLEKAVEHGTEAARLAPNDERIQINLKHYLEALDGHARIPSGGSV